MATKLRSVYQLKVQLNNIRPPIWRRILVADSVTLGELHEIIQIAMGWTNSHLHQFPMGNKRFGSIDPDFDMDWDDDLQDEEKISIKKLLTKKGDTLGYEYDFGDSWRHKITLEAVLPFEPSQKLPCCIKGKRGCPPEDIGGPWRYGEFLQQWADDSDSECEELREWVGDHFQPEKFDANEVNGIFKSVFGVR